MKTVDLIKLFYSILSPRAKLEAKSVERMGLLAIKIAQMYAVRSDLLPPEKCLELCRFLQNTTPLRHEEFIERWRAVVPPSFERICSSFDPAPIASASLGQVHRACLRDGRQVAVKISRSEQRNKFLADVRAAKRLLRLALAFYPKLARLADPLGALATVERQTLLEMDFRAEQSGAARLAELAAESSAALPHLASLQFPAYFPELSNRNFLVSEYVEGHTIAEWLQHGELPYEVLLDLFRIQGFFLFVQGEFHGDLHPGNVIWRDNRFWFLDNANVETVPQTFARGLLQMLVCLGQEDIEAAGNQLAELSTTPLPNSARKEFIAGFNQLYRGFCGQTVAEKSLTRQMMETVNLAVRHGIEFPLGAFPLIKSLMYLDGMVLRCNPRAVLLRDVAKFADDFPPISTRGAAQPVARISVAV